MVAGEGWGKGEMLWSVNLALVELHAGGRRRESFLPHSALSPVHLVPQPLQTLQLAPFYVAPVAPGAHVGRSAGWWRRSHGRAGGDSGGGGSSGVWLCGGAVWLLCSCYLYIFPL